MHLVESMRSRPLLRAVFRLLVPVRLRTAVATRLVITACPDARFVRTPAWSRPLPPPSGARPAPAANEAFPGVNIFGYLRGQFGLAESARAYAAALIGAAVPVALIDIELDLPHGMEDRTLHARLSTEAPYDVNLLFVNPDYLDQALDSIDPERLRGRYMLACWFWELEQIPVDWHPSIAVVDEIMVATSFIGRAFHKATPKPILLAPLPLVEVVDSGLTRSDFGLEEGKFTFLATFDFNSWVARKNPYAVIDSFQRAFRQERDDVRLIIKSSNGHRLPDELVALIERVASDPRIVVRDDVIAREHVHALQRCVDVYVSLHRAEGFGLGMAESMAQGKPVIATRWSGNMDFMDDSNSCLIDYRLVPVKPGEYPHADGARWAEADIDSAASAMRQLADDPQAARRLGARAAADVRSRLAPEVTAECIRRRLVEIQKERVGSMRVLTGEADQA